MPPLVHRVWSFYIICSRPPPRPLLSSSSSSSSCYSSSSSSSSSCCCLFFWLFPLWSLACVRSSSRTIALRHFWERFTVPLEREKRFSRTGKMLALVANDCSRCIVCWYTVIECYLIQCGDNFCAVIAKCNMICMKYAQYAIIIEPEGADSA